MIDWKKIAIEVGSLEDGYEQGSSTLAKRAMERLLGEENLRVAVDYYISRQPGAELVRSVLWELRPWSAMAHCHELFQAETDLDIRRSAVELLRVVADGRALPWVKEFLDDPDEKIQAWGAGVLDQLLWSELISLTDAEPTLAIAEQHSNERVRQTTVFIRNYLNARLELESSAQTPRT